jgi:hypothetical protein
MIPRPLRNLTAASLAIGALSFAMAMPSGSAAGIIPRGPVSDVVVNVTAGANDPVRGATVVARDDRTGKIMSSATTTGDLGYTVIRLRPGASPQRITISATGGTSGAVGKLSRTDDALAATVQRADADAAIEVNVNPATTIQAAYLDLRPGATLANSEKTVARRLGLTPDIPLDEAGRYSRVKFSGEAFAREAENRGGIDAYADWAASRIAAGTALPKYAAPDPRDDLPLRGLAPRRQNAIGAKDVVWSFLVKPLLEFGGKLLLCELGVTGLCLNTEAPPVQAQLPPELKQQLAGIEQGISNLNTQMTTIQLTLSGISGLVNTINGQVSTLRYSSERNAVDAVLDATQAAAAFRVQGEPVPAQIQQILRNALVRLHGINGGCPDWPALVGQLPPSVLKDDKGQPRYPGAACAREQGVGAETGLMQFAQRTLAARAAFVAAGPTQDRVDTAGEFWVGEFARDIFATNAAAADALQAGTSALTPTAVQAASEMFEDVITAIDADASGNYFGARIPHNQVVAMGATTEGTIFGIGHFKDPGNCRGGKLRNVRYTFMNPTRSRGKETSESSYLPAGAEPPDKRGADGTVDRSWPACTSAQLVEPPPPLSGAPDTLGWKTGPGVPADLIERVRVPLRQAALCHIQAVRIQVPSPVLELEAGANFCSRPVIPERPIIEWEKGNKTLRGELPNLQLSQNHDACAPWEIGTTNNMTREPSANIRDLPTAVGMQCPVIDLTPGVTNREGWNCVSANPAGRVGTNPVRGGRGSFARAIPPTFGVTSSLSVLNDHVLGGYCPNWGWRPVPTGLENVTQWPRWEAAPGGGWRVATPHQGTYCSPAFGDGHPTFGDSHFDCRGGASNVDRPTPAPLQGLIRELTSYSQPDASGKTAKPSAARLQQFRDVGINFEAPNWTQNNPVAGDFVVGPLFTSGAVGVYVPGTTVVTPSPAGAPTRSQVRPPTAVRDLTVKCVEPCAGPVVSARIRWRAPLQAGSFPIRRYVVRARVAGAWRDLPGVGCDTRAMECTIRDPEVPVNGDTTVFRVLVVTTRGPSGGVATVDFNPGLGLDAPMLTPIDAGLKVRWSTPLAEKWRAERYQGQWSYTATASPGGRSCTVDATGQTLGTLNLEATTCTITGLDPGVKYTVTVAGTVSYRMWSTRPERRFLTGWDLDPSPPSAPATPTG